MGTVQQLIPAAGFSADKASEASSWDRAPLFPGTMDSR